MTEFEKDTHDEHRDLDSLMSRMTCMFPEIIYFNTLYIIDDDTEDKELEKYFLSLLAEVEKEKSENSKSSFLPDSQIVNQQYDNKLKEWLGSDNNMKLLYRASEHGYSAKSFHNYCDNQGPTLIVIKSSEGWIFGGYTTQSWSGDGIYMILYMIINR